MKRHSTLPARTKVQVTPRANAGCGLKPQERLVLVHVDGRHPACERGVRIETSVREVRRWIREVTPRANAGCGLKHSAAEASPK